MIDLAAFAEDAFAYVPPVGPVVHEDRAAYRLRHLPNPHPAFGMVLRPRLAADAVDDAIADTRAWFRELGRERFTWLVGPSATPSDLRARLLEAGALPDDVDPVFAGMVRTEPPPEVPGIDVHRITTWEEREAGARVTWAANDAEPPDVDAALALMRKAWEELKDDPRAAGFVAVVDGEVVGYGSATFTPAGAYLIAGSVLERFRGRGVYRALVRARWDEAVRRGTPVLVVQAGKMSRPILDRLGFRTLCEIHALVDRSGA